MAREDAQLAAAKRAYRDAKELGNRQEEARWSNVIGDILKNRGEYVEALKWLRIDYDVSVKYLPEKQLLATCQSLGEVYLRLEDFEEALYYQKKHLELARDSDDLVEQQRASTQLGRTYHEMFLRSDDDHYSVRNAKKYFKSAMKLAQSLKENPPSNNSSFLKEYIDAHNNIGMLEKDLDNLEAAKKILIEGLRICDEEEVIEDNDGRSRLHHNLGNVYMELRMWDKALENIEKDILICQRIGHCQGEAKGFINLGEFHYRVQKYEEAIRCYKKALNLAESMEDEDAMTNQINQNIETVKEATKVLADLKQEEQKLKKLTRTMVSTKGTAGERKCLLQQNTSLDRLIEKSSVIFAWPKHREFAKKKKRIAHQLCDKEKLSDSFLAIGESYQKLRDFNKALKWFEKSWEIYKAIGNLEGQALAKINIGDVLDSDGHWSEALAAFEEGYRIALEAKLPFVQLSALENIHYSHMIRFDHVEEARRLQDKIDDLKKSKNRVENLAEECCSETDTEGEEDKVSYSRSNASCSKRKTDSNYSGSKPPTRVNELNEDAPLSSLFQPREAKRKATHVENTKTCPKRPEASPIGLTKSNENQQTVSERKRLRVVLSDDEDELQDETACSHVQLHNNSAEGIATSDEIKNQTNSHSPAGIFQDISAVGLKCANDSCNPVNLEESTCSFKSRNSTGRGSQNGKEFRSSSSNGPFSASNLAACSSRCDIDISGECLQRNAVENLSLHTSTDGYGQSVSFRINNGVIHLDISSLMVGGDLSMASMKVQVACLYYLQLSSEKRSNGLLPIIHQMRFNGRTLEPFETTDTFMDIVGKGCIEVLVGGWVQKRMIKLYVDCCHKLCEAPNMKLLKKLYTLEVEDEIVVSDCELQDISVVPLLDALHALNSVAVLDLSHNLLGNGTMEKLHQVFTSLGQTYGDLSLDLHCNRFGSTALFQICECPAMLTRLVVLNISGNRLTDACGSYVTTILKTSLYSLNVERCSITSRTIQKIADALDVESVLSQLCIGYNNPITGKAISSLLSKLSVMKRFSELNLNGLKLSKSVVENLCQLAKIPSLSGLLLGETGIGTDGALRITDTLASNTQEIVKLDLSYCGLTSDYISKLSAHTNLISCVLELRIGGNPIMQEGGDAVASLLRNPHCSLKVLVLCNCKLGLDGILHIIQALAENSSLEEVNLAENNPAAHKDSQYDLKEKKILENLRPVFNGDEKLPDSCTPKSVGPVQQGSSVMSADCSQLEVADSEDCAVSKEPAISGFDDSCASSFQKNQSEECQYIRDIATAISMAKRLELLDLSTNGFSVEAVETLWSAWSSSHRTGSACRHVKSQIIIFSVDGKECREVKPCCKKD